MEARWLKSDSQTIDICVQMRYSFIFFLPGWQRALPKLQSATSQLPSADRPEVFIGQNGSDSENLQRFGSFRQISCHFLFLYFPLGCVWSAAKSLSAVSPDFVKTKFISKEGMKTRNAGMRANVCRSWKNLLGAEVRTRANMNVCFLPHTPHLVDLVS